MCLGQIFVKNAKNDTGTIFERSKSDQILKSEKCRNPRKKRKKWPFGHLKRQNSLVFQERDLKILYTYLSISVLSHIFRLFFIKKNPRKLEKKTFSVILFPIFFITPKSEMAV